MMNEIDPVINNWYQHLDKGQEFRVIAIDQSADVIEIQYFDGNVDEMDFDSWYDSELELSEEPENWAGAVDIENPDDYGTEITDTTEDDWNGPLREQSAEAPDDEEGPALYLDGGDERMDLELIPFDEGMESSVL